MQALASQSTWKEYMRPLYCYRVFSKSTLKKPTATKPCAFPWRAVEGKGSLFIVPQGIPWAVSSHAWGSHRISSDNGDL